MGKRSFKKFVEQELGGVAHFLIYAVLEWTLIILLFINGFLVFFANEFAKFFELKTPCLLCTQIDHLLVHRNPDFCYNESLCEEHQKHVSTLAFCHAHKKLSDIKKMCERCLLSFATEKESDCETYKSLVGILHKDIEMFLDDDQEIYLSLPVGKKDDYAIQQVDESSEHFCSCCGEPLKAKSPYGRGRKAAFLSSAPAPSPRAPCSSFKNDENRNLSLSNLRFSRLKLGDKDSENQGYDDGSNSVSLGKQYEDKTPNVIRGNKFFRVPLTDFAPNTPRWATKLSRKSLLERTDFASESTEANAPNEGDNESMFHQWNRQVKLDRKSLIELYMELDEERSASAVAANNAMAMITRLQTEKAAVQMEALQYQRMMEEQAEYDEEALQEMNGYITRREIEIKDLEAELDAYRAKYGCLEEDDIIVQGDEKGQVHEELKLPSYLSKNGSYEDSSIDYNLEQRVNEGGKANKYDRSGSLLHED